MESYIKRFNEISIADTASVGGKNSSLGEMFSKLSSRGIKVPDGFATTTYAFEEFLTHNSLRSPLYDLIQHLDKKNYSNLKETGAKARKLLFEANLPKNLELRSSATAEDLPKASFAGQHESYLNIKGEYTLLNAVKKCFASTRRGKSTG